MCTAKQNYGAPFSATTAGTTHSVALVAAPGANKFHYITDISGSADLGGATITVKTNTTVLWQDKLAQPFSLATVTTPYLMSFTSPLVGTANGTVSVTVGSATSLSWANISGFTV